MRQVLGWVIAVGFAVLPLVAVWLSGSDAARGAVQRVRRGDRSRRAGRSRADGPGTSPASEQALVSRLLAGELDPAAYRDAMTALARREAARSQRPQPGPP